MSWATWVRSIFQTSIKKQQNQKSPTRLGFENLEERVMPYSASGNAWPNPQLITLSFMPDGTQMSSAAGHSITSNLFSTMNARFGSPAVWEAQILRAAQVWAQQTNINFVVVPDNGAPSGSGSYEQGDPGFGDIRIGGYAFSNSQLGNTFYPPQSNNYSIAGDVALNTGQTWNIGSTYDLFTVAAHEIGHALGLGSSSAGTNAIMYGTYTGVKTALSADDIAGIQNIYSSNHGRTPDAYDAGAGNNTVATASNIGSLINPTSLTALVNNLDITTTTDVDYYTFAAPSGTSNSLTVQVQSQGLSLLSPKVTVYAANGTTVLGSASGLNQYGTTLDVAVTGVTAGEQFYVKVQGADTTAFSTGAYALALKFGGGTMPVSASPNTQRADGNPLSGSGGVADYPNNADQLLGSTPLITGISPDNGSSSSDGVTNANRIVFSGTAPLLDGVRLYQVGVNGAPDQLIGSTVAVGTIWSFDYTNHALSDGAHTYYIKVGPLLGLLGDGSSPSTTYTVVIDTVAPNKPVISGITPDTGASSTDGVTNINDPTLLGTAEANSTVSVYENSQLVGTTAADSNGNWQYNSQSLPDGRYTFTATATDLAGNVGSLSSAFVVTIDTQAPTAPVITGISSSTGASSNSTTNLQNINILGQATAGTTVQVFNNGVPIGSTTVGSNGTWTFNYTSTTLAYGTYSFAAIAIDTAGNESQLSQPLLVTIENPLTLSGTANDGSLSNPLGTQI